MKEKRRILFVDDEPKVLEGIRRMLRCLRKEWDMSFAGGGQEALDILADNHMDVVVSDMRMPGMTGVELLTQVKERYPTTVRIALSGQASQDIVLRCTGPVHQYLLKPTDAGVLKSTVERVCMLKEILSVDRLRGLTTQLESLPSMPALYAELQTQSESASVSLETLSRVISQDLAMSAKVLQLANSAFFGSPRRVSSPADAVAHLGLETVKALVLSVQVFSQLDDNARKTFSLDHLWKHSLAVASASRQIAISEEMDQEVVDHAFLAGLLHDVGKLALAVILPEEYGSTLQHALTQGIETHKAETDRLGATHAEVGAYLLGLWGYADPIIQAVAYHHRPAAAVSEGFDALTAAHVANALAGESDPPSSSAPSRIDRDYLEQLGLVERLEMWSDAFSQNDQTREAS
ncbi:MAG: HDOD domain-containing protein [Candidatus Eisenbacteria sp.]|nr:HDOD domain-containing protein [Candidatus Eisenbacteria bacterium]